MFVDFVCNFGLLFVWLYFCLLMLLHISFALSLVFLVLCLIIFFLLLPYRLATEKLET